MNGEKDRLWAETAIKNELDIIKGLPVDTNIRKPNNACWACLYRLAGVVNGSQYHDSNSVLNSIKFYSRHLSYTPREMDYQWKRALDRADPRERQQ